MNKRYLLHDLDEEEAALSGALPDDVLLFAAKPEVKHCIGCFGCWIKTPGHCVIRDRCSISPALMASSGEMIVVSRLTYGGLSSAVKGVIDRSIGYLMPYFRTVGDEMHHTMRYDNPFKLTVHFYGDDATEFEQALARQLVAANAVNLGAGSTQVFFHESAPSLKEVL